MGLKEYIQKKEKALRRKAVDEANKSNGTNDEVADDIRDQRKAAIVHYRKLVRKLGALDASFDIYKLNGDYMDFEYQLDIDIEEELSRYALNADFNDETQEVTLCLQNKENEKISKARVPYHNFLEVVSLEDIIEKLLTEIDKAFR